MGPRAEDLRHGPGPPNPWEVRHQDGTDHGCLQVRHLLLGPQGGHPGAGWLGLRICCLGSGGRSSPTGVGGQAGRWPAGLVGDALGLDP